MVAGGAFVVGRFGFKSVPKPSPASVVSTTAPSPKLTVRPSIAPIDLSSTSLNVSTWEEQTLDSLGLKLKIPNGWISINCPTGGGPTYCTTFGPPVDPGQNGGYNGPLNVVDLDPYVDQNDIARLKTSNFIIGAISSLPNAVKVIDSAGPRVVFKYRGTGQYYTFRLSLSGDQEGYDPQAEKIMELMAANLSFIDTSDCTSPAVLPLKSFPTDFELINYHDSDGSDPVVKQLGDNVATFNKPSSQRVFIVQYVKSGSSFPANSDFLNSVSQINPYSNRGDVNGTGIEAVNCGRLILPEIDTNTTSFHLTKDSNDAYGIIAYGKGDNPTKLWGQSLWNTKLLQSTRNEVYIKQGNLMQKYAATTYSAYKSTCCLGGKPAIYLYPKKDTHVNVTIDPQGEIIKTDNLYKVGQKGWSVDVKKDGLIENSLPYLYYEVNLDMNQPTKGFVIPFENLFIFSRNYVKNLGLNDKEADEFISFWKEKLTFAPYYFISNLDRSTIDQIYPLKIDPTPDVLLRVELYFKPLKEKISVDKPSLPKVEQRKGFTAVEWGGILDKSQ